MAEPGKADVLVGLLIAVGDVGAPRDLIYPLVDTERSMALENEAFSLDIEYSVLDIGYSLLDIGYSVLVIGYSVLVIGYSLPRMV